MCCGSTTWRATCWATVWCLTDSAELLLDPSTYVERSTASTRVPGALVEAMRFVL
jgi:hypothetical protein